MEIILSKNVRLFFYPRASPPIQVRQTCTTWNYYTNIHNPAIQRHVSNILLQHASSKHQDDYIVLTGDRKKLTNTLWILKQLYGSELDKVLIFPGDWHGMSHTIISQY